MAEKKSMGFIMGYFNHPFKWSLYSNPYLQPVTSGSFTPCIRSHHLPIFVHRSRSPRIQSARWRSCATKVGTSKLPAPCWRWVTGNQSQPCWPALTLKKTPTRRVFKASLKKAPRLWRKVSHVWWVDGGASIGYFICFQCTNVPKGLWWIRARSKISKQLDTKTLGSA